MAWRIYIEWGHGMFIPVSGQFKSQAAAEAHYHKYGHLIPNLPKDARPIYLKQ